MTPDLSAEQWRRISQLVHRAQELARGERPAFVKSACEADAQLRADVEAVLGNPLDGGADTLARLSEALAKRIGAAEVGPSDSIGPYYLLQKVGEGGMGDVWLAEQSEPVRRRVALKVIKVGMDTKQVVARFAAEQQALALMDHPCVSKVFDAGSTPTGRPYFVMEYVAGLPITEYCDRHRLSVRERLDLFMRVCEGVQHAHQKAIIHRDLKPSNVLVSLQDGKAVPKIIDFGVAKATAQRLTEQTIFTELGVLIGTPEYMSPEQAELTGEDVDTRTDVYALGVMLYELLVGVLPFDARELRGVGFDEIRRRIREVEPPRPSTRVRTLGEGSVEAARNRRTDPGRLAAGLRGDLDWIVMKALEKDRRRRYGSPSELAADLERHLRHEPVLAGPPAAGYRARKFVRRHRFGVGVASAALVALTGGVVTSTTLYVRSLRAERQARAEASRADQVVAFLQNMLRTADPDKARGQEPTVREVLDEASRTIETELAGVPEAQEAVRWTIAGAYESLGFGDAALPHTRWVLDFRRRKYGDADERTLQAYRWLGLEYQLANRFDESAAVYREYLEIAARRLGEEHPRTIDAMSQYGNNLRNRGDLEEAEKFLTRAHEIADRVFKPGDETVILGVLEQTQLYGVGDVVGDVWLESVWNLGGLYGAQGRFREARPLYERAMSMAPKVYGEEYLWTIRVFHETGQLYLEAGWRTSAEPVIEEAVARARRSLGDRHPVTALAVMTEGLLRKSQEDRVGAEQRLREALLILDRSDREAVAERHAVLDSLARLLVEEGRVEEARPLTRERLSLLRRLAEAEGAGEGALHDYAWHLLGCLPADQRDPAAALTAAQKAVARSGRRNPVFLDTLARAHAMLGENARAIEIAREAVAQLPVRWTLQSQSAEATLVRLLEESGQPGAAEEVLRRRLSGRREGLPPEHADVAMALETLGLFMARHQRPAEAVDLMREALAIRRRALPQGDWQIADTAVLLGDLLAQSGALEEAEALLQEGHAALQQDPDAPLDRAREAEKRLGDLHARRGDAPEGPGGSGSEIRRDPARSRTR